MNSTPFQDADLITQLDLAIWNQIQQVQIFYVWPENITRFNQQATSEYFHSQTQQPPIKEVTSYCSEVSPVSWTHPFKTPLPLRSPALLCFGPLPWRDSVMLWPALYRKLAVWLSYLLLRLKEKVFSRRLRSGQPVIIAKGQRSYQSAIRI